MFDHWVVFKTAEPSDTYVPHPWQRLMADRHRIHSRSRRLWAYLTFNRDRMIVDVLVILTWVIATRTIFGTLELPAWSFYLVLFVGVIVYSRVTEPWSRPYRSPDIEANSEEL